MKKSSLRGSGGAGFTTAVKLYVCRNTPEGQRYIICNADEGEPGTFKDRVLLNSFADRIFEGMLICGYATGATEGIVYLRGEYEYMRAQLETRLSELRAKRLLGAGICGVPGFDFDIEVCMGAGAYVCGEETALIESLEGKPGRPRVRPPYPVTNGYKGRPTVVNNVETLCKITEVMRLGGAAYAGLGTKQSTGTKLISVSGDCERPGIYEYPWGVRVSTILDECGASECWRRSGQRRVRRRAWLRTSSAAASLSKTFRRPAPSSSSTRTATWWKWSGILPISSRTKAAVSARPAASAHP